MSNLKIACKSLFESIRSFHKEESALSTLESVALLAAGVVIIGLVLVFGHSYWTSVQTNITNLK
jgi:predicted negative regulator of RcsB-dependent stress response